MGNRSAARHSALYIDKMKTKVQPRDSLFCSRHHPISGSSPWLLRCPRVPRVHQFLALDHPCFTRPLQNLEPPSPQGGPAEAGRVNPSGYNPSQWATFSAVLA